MSKLTRKAGANLIERVELLAGYTLYSFQSPSNPDYKYRVLTKDGIADPATHSDCITFTRTGDCPHWQSVIAHETDYAAAYDATTEAAKGTEVAHNVIDMAAVVAAKVARRYTDANLEAFDNRDTAEYPIVGHTYRITSSRWGLDLD